MREGKKRAKERKRGCVWVSYWKREREINNVRYWKKERDENNERGKKESEGEKERMCVRDRVNMRDLEREIIWENKRQRERERWWWERQREDVCEREILRKIERKRERKRVRESKKIWFWISVIS